MTSNRLLAACTCLLLTLVSLPVYANDWPQFQGPDRNAISSEKGLLRKWPETGPKQIWSVAVGPGYGSPAVRDGEVYVLDRKDDIVDILRCLSLADGKELWNYTYESPGKFSHNGSRTAPTIDEKYVYSVGLMGDFLCVDRKTHQPVWRKNIVTDFGSEHPRWGVAQSPCLYKNLVIVAAQAPDAFVVAYDRVSGKEVWKSPGLGLPGYTSPMVTTLAGVEQLVVIAASNKPGTEKGTTAGISLTDGKVLWKYDGWQCFIPIPHPTPLPGDKLFITAGYGAGSVIIQVKKGKDGLEVSEVLKLAPEVCGSQIQQPILYKDCLYVNSNSNEESGGMRCIALDGTVKWQTSGSDALPNFDKGAFILADDMIFAVDGKTGKLHLFEPNTSAYKELAQAQVIEGRELWAPLALTDGKLLVRSQDVMKCLDVKNP
jgi:outer membrane protein assembly factor BamB